MFGLFNIFALIYIFRGAQIVLNVRSQWSALHEEPLARAKKQLAENASFFLAVPPGVAVHEFCHAAATWLFGGQIVDFGYGVFWGYVVPVGNFTPWQDWFIALAGTLGNLVYGALIFFIFRNHKSSSFRFFGLRAFRFQIYFALLYYPLFTIIMLAANTGGSDWAVIYDFSSTPIISSITAVFHLGGLLLFFIADRNGRFEMPGFDSAQIQENFFALEKEAHLSPETIKTQILYFTMLYEGGAQNRAKHELKTYLDKNPNIAEGWLRLAQFETDKTVEKKAKQYAEKALQLGLSDKKDQAAAHMLVGRYLAKGDLTQAKHEMDIAINTAVPKQDPEQQSPRDLLKDANLYYWRSQLLQRQNELALADQDINHAVHFAEMAKSETAVAYYKNEQQKINNQKIG